MTLRVAQATLLVALLAGAAVAAILVTSTSTIQLTVGEVPVRFSLGDGAAKDRYVSNVTVTSNRTSFSASIIGRLGGDATVKDVVRLANVDDATRSVTLNGQQVTNANIPIITWTVRSGSTTIATLDMRQSSPSATFDLASGTTYQLDLRVKVLRGVASSETEFTTGLWAVVS